MAQVILAPCKECGTLPEIDETYDTLRIVCPKCGNSTRQEYGDYYDEAFMWATYGNILSKEWNDKNA